MEDLVVQQLVALERDRAGRGQLREVVPQQRFEEDRTQAQAGFARQRVGHDERVEKERTDEAKSEAPWRLSVRTTTEYSRRRSTRSTLQKSNIMTSRPLLVIALVHPTAYRPAPDLRATFRTAWIVDAPPARCRIASLASRGHFSSLLSFCHGSWPAPPHPRPVCAAH
jgi:hypothetical protein